MPERMVSAIAPGGHASGDAGAYPAPALVAPERRALTGPAWDLYLAAAAALVALVVPGGPGQTAVVDVFNLVALAAFGCVVLMRGIPLSPPFMLPVLIVATGSLFAMISAASIPAALLAMAQDVYLYGWFVMLATVMSRRGEFVRVRVAWVVAADLVALYCILGVATGHSPGIGIDHSWRDLLPSSDFRPSATFSNANQFGDYLMATVFVLLGLMGRVSMRFVVASAGLIGLAMVATKSNGTLIATFAGVMVWAGARTWGRGLQPVRAAGLAFIALASVALLSWAHVEWGVGANLMRSVQQRSFVGRLSKSTGDRERIWQTLATDYERSPLGIGPGNSSMQMLAIGHRERGGAEESSLQGKEAHSDYLAYAVERGPIGFVGLLAFIVAAFARVLRGRRRIAARVAGPSATTLWAACLGALTAMCVHSLVIEALHFRHVWFALAIICALTTRPETPPARASLSLERRRPTDDTPAALPAS
jgi:O-antigen ligase